mmetsp:Transcript_6671/g.16405  ORF Transcript_6671/g.16405 Transcript_6671/m.16405 type:complete len:645 (-) Transcript_6671:147-2081(-)
MIAASKLLILGGLLVGCVEIAASIGAEEGRQLSFRHPSEGPSTRLSEDSKDYYYKSEKTSKSKGNGKKSSKDFGKGFKSEKKEKYFHVQNDYEVHYEIVMSPEHEENPEDEEGHSVSKSSKNRPMIPQFEYIEVGYKSWKSSKTSKYEDSDYYNYKSAKASKYEDSDYYGYLGKSGKAYKDGKSTTDSSKSPKTPTVSPVPTIAPAPTSTPRPTGEGSFGIGVPHYSLAYTLMNKNEPTMEELKELEKATRSYLSDFFIDEFNEDDFTIFEEFITDMIDYSASQNQPVVVDFESVGRFDSLSLITPTPTQLGSAAKQSFTGLRMIQYEDWLKEMLSSDNSFVGSKVQFYEDGQGVPDAIRRGIGATGIAASAVAVTLLAAGFVLYRSKSDRNGSEIDKLDKSPGDMTVAGETFAGETYDGTVSDSTASVDYVRRYNDEEEGTKLETFGSTLGSIPESNDTSSLEATWSDDADESVPGRGIAAKNTMSAFRGGTRSFQDAALQAPTYGKMFQENIMRNPSSGDEKSQMSDSELSQFVASARDVDNEASGGHTLEIKSLLSLDSMDDNTSDDLSVRDNSSRRLRTVAEIEAMLSSELTDSKAITQIQSQLNRPRTVEEIETLLTADDDETIIEEIPFSDEDESIIE